MCQRSTIAPRMQASAQNICFSAAHLVFSESFASCWLWYPKHFRVLLQDQESSPAPGRLGHHLCKAPTLWIQIWRMPEPKWRIPSKTRVSCCGKRTICSCSREVTVCCQHRKVLIVTRSPRSEDCSAIGGHSSSGFPLYPRCGGHSCVPSAARCPCTPAKPR